MLYRSLLALGAGATTFILASAQSDPAAGTGQRLSTAETLEVLARADHAQSSLRMCTMEFAFEYALELPRIPNTYISERSFLLGTDGVVTGTMHWSVDGNREQLTITTDLAVPPNHARYEFEDGVFLNDGEKIVHLVTRTDQVALMPPGPIPAPVPSDWLYPIGRKTFQELRQIEGVAFEASRAPNGVVALTIKGATSDGSNVTCVLDREWDYAVTRWTRFNGAAQGSITYARDTSGRVLPVNAIREVYDEGNTLLRRDTLTVQATALGRVDAREFQFQFRPGMLVADNRVQSDDDTIRVYDVNSRGELVEAKVFDLSQKPAKSWKSVALGLTGILTLLGAILFRGRTAIVG